MSWIARLLASSGLAFALCSAPGQVTGAEPGWQDALTGRLRQIKETRVVRLGYREAAIPFSYRGAEGKPVGYSLDVCSAIVATIAADLGDVPLVVDYVPVSPLDE